MEAVPPTSPQPGSMLVTGKPVASSMSATNPARGAAARKASNTLTLQDAVTFLLQLIALIVALIFGAWAIKSYNAALTANQLTASSIEAADQQNAMALAAGQLSMVSYCQSQLSGLDEPDRNFCQAVIAAFPLASIAVGLSLSVPPLPPPTSTTTSSITAATSSPQSPASTNSTQNSQVTSFAPPLTETTTGSIAIPSQSTAEGTSSSSVTPIPGVSALPPNLPSSIASPQLTLGDIVGIIVGAVGFVGSAFALVMIWRRRLVIGTSSEGES